MTIDSMNVSWSASPIVGEHLLIRLGRVVTTISKVLDPLVGKSTICSRLHVEKVSRKHSLMSFGYRCSVIEFVDQSMSDIFMSPKPYWVCFIFFCIAS